MRKVSLVALLVICLVGVRPIFADDDDVSSLYGKANPTAEVWKVDSNDQMYFRQAIEAVTTSDSVTAVESGKQFNVAPASTAVFFTLPSAAAGLDYTFTATTGNASPTKTIVLDPASSDTFVGCVNGTSATTFVANDRLISPGATGDSVRITGTASNQWVCSARTGTWADYNQ